MLSLKETLGEGRENFPVKTIKWQRIKLNEWELPTKITFTKKKKRKAKAGSGGDYITEHIVDQNYWRVTPKVIMDC